MYTYLTNVAADLGIASEQIYTTHMNVLAAAITVARFLVDKT